MRTNPKKNSEPHPQEEINHTSDPYKRVAQIYDKVFEPLNSGLRSIGMKMFSPREGMAVLDVGCGTGVHLELYQKVGCDVFGIDLSSSMLKVARRRLGEKAHLHLGDASKMPYSGKTFDLIIMSTVLHEMPDEVRSAVLHESERVIKTDGRILLIDFHPGPVRPFKGWVYKSIINLAEVLAGRDHYRNYRNFMGNEGLQGLISSHGLTIDQKKIVSGGNMALFLIHTG
jgi:ubiquinone/menaquinone biosynthesis C-methylase UbiE